MEDAIIEESTIKKKKKKKKIAIITLSSVVVIGCAATFYLMRDKSLKFDGTNISGYVLGHGVEPGLTPEELQELLNKKVDESKIAFSIYSEPVFKGRKGTIMFANPRYSAHDLDVSVTLDGKEIIKTEKIKPDQYIEQISLMGKALKKGKHNAVALVTGYDKKTGKVVGEVAIDMIITSE